MANRVFDTCGLTIHVTVITSCIINDDLNQSLAHYFYTSVTFILHCASYLFDGSFAIYRGTTLSLC